MPIEKILFQPGVNKEGTQYSADTGWFDSDKVRFRKGRVEKIGGWQKSSPDSIEGIPRALRDWKDPEGTGYLFAGTTYKQYILSGQVYYDVTPIRTTTSGTATFTCVGGSSTITVTDASAGSVLLNDSVTFSGAADLGGGSGILAADLNQEYVVTSVDGNDFTITCRDAVTQQEKFANASVSNGGGASTEAEYQINVGLDAAGAGVPPGSWGESPWDEGVWGGDNTFNPAFKLRAYGSDVFASDLIFNVRFGGVYYWVQSDGLTERAINIADATKFPNALEPPTSCLQVMVSDVDRHVICFGVNPIGSSTLDPLFVRWSDQENAFDWLPTATNSSGGQVLSTGTEIVGAVKTRQEIIIFTDEGITSMRFVGGSFVYAFSVVANNISMVSPNAGVAIGDSVYFMDSDGFYVYSGSVTRIPCSVHAFVFENLNREQREKVFAYNNPDFSEVTWFYPVGEGNTESTNYVTFNYQEQSWVIGTLTRGAFISAQTRNYPVGGSADLNNPRVNYIYDHEFGYDADGEELVAFVESGGFDLSDGDRFAFGKRFIPDFRFEGASEAADINITIKGRDFPLDDFTNLSETTIMSNSKQAHIRTRAREMAVKIESVGRGYKWTLGDMRFDFRTDGKR